MLTAGGNPEAFNEAKRGLLYAILGMIVIFGTYTIIATVAYNVSGGKFDYSNFIPLECKPIEDVKTDIKYGPVVE